MKAVVDSQILWRLIQKHVLRGFPILNDYLIKTSHNISPVEYLISSHKLGHSGFILLFLKLLESLMDALAEEPEQDR